MSSIHSRLFLFLLLSAASCDAQQKLTNIDYLGRGYDLIYGNPHSDLQDPGFRDAIFLLDYKTKSTSMDGKWLVPDNVEALQTVGCGYETDSTIIHGSTSYVNSLSVDTSVEASFWVFKFSASTGYKEVHEGSSSYRRSYVSSKAKCLLYHASIERLMASRVTDQFYLAVKELLSTNNTDQYIRFISMFGTHYSSGLDMGSKVVVRSEFEETAWTKLDRYNFDFKSAAQASFLGFTGSLTFSTEKNKELAQSFDSNRTSLSVSYMGCRPPSDGKWETWMSSSEESPYPISYVLRPITELLSPQYFPNISEQLLSEKRAILNATYEIYCRGIIGCGKPDPDRTPVGMDNPEAAIIGTHRVSCRGGMMLLSCGLGNLPFDTSAESRRCAVPYDNKTCECYAYAGAVCHPWCTNVATGLERRVSGFTKGEFQVDCPQGKQVVACTIDARASPDDEWQRSHYPMSDGSGCMCYANKGAACHAMCASNFRQYEILSQYGRNNVTVECSQGNYVFGCGVQPLQRGDPERYRTYMASSVTSCTCFDRTGVTCYAICGQFA